MAFSADNIQLVLYPVPNAPVPDAAAVFTKLFDKGADSFQRPPSPFQASVAQGTAGEYGVSIQAIAGRLDAFYTGAPNPHGLPSEIVEPLSAIEAGADALTRAAAAYPALRLAIVLNLTDTLGTDDELAARLKECLPDVPVLGNPIDFSYQLNVPTTFSTGETLNRVARWSGASQQFFGFSQASGAQTPFVVQERKVMTWTIDVSSAVAHATPFSADDARRVVSELAHEAKALLSEGVARLTHQ